jgi:hypothetical protein
MYGVTNSMLNKILAEVSLQYFDFVSEENFIGSFLYVIGRILLFHFFGILDHMLLL